MSSKSSRITSDGMEYHTFMKLTNGYIQKDNTGVIIPQMIYSLIDDPAANKWFAQSRLPPIHFTLDHSDKVGVRLSHLLKASVAQPLSSKSQPTMRAPSMPIAGVVICWPGQAPWISTLAKSVVLGFQGGMVMPELGECIAKKIAEFLKEHNAHKVDGAYKGWETARFDLDSLYLLQLHNVGPGLWQPVLSGIPNDVVVGR